MPVAFPTGFAVRKGVWFSFHVVLGLTGVAHRFLLGVFAFMRDPLFRRKKKFYIGRLWPVFLFRLYYWRVSRVLLWLGTERVAFLSLRVTRFFFGVPLSLARGKGRFLWWPFSCLFADITLAVAGLPFSFDPFMAVLRAFISPWAVYYFK